MNPAELKQAQSRLTEAEARLKTAEITVQEVRQEAERYRNTCRQLKEMIAKATSGKLVITEHAILRYLERVGSIDLKQVEADMVPDSVRQQIAVLGNGEFPCGNYSIRVKNNVVVTVIPHEPSHKPV